MVAPARYRDVVAHAVTRRLWLATVASAIGDFVGAGALLVLAYEQAGGRAIGSAGLLAATGAGTLAVALLGGPLLDRLDRRRGMVGVELLGAAGLLLPLLAPSLVTAYLAAFVLGVTRSAGVSIRHGVLADAVPERLRAGLLALSGTTDQASQVVGYATGATLAVLVGASTALLFDLVTFVVAAVILLGLALPGRADADAPPGLVGGWRTMAGHPQLRLLTLLVAGSAAASAIPETLAAAAVGSDSGWLPVVLAAGPAGAALGYLVAGRAASTERFQGQLWHLTAFAAAVLLGVAANGPLAWTLVNVAVGAGAAWVVGPQVSLVRLTNPARISQVMVVVVAVGTLTEGSWTLVAGAVADRTTVSTAYGLMGAVVAATAAAGWLVHRARGDQRYRWDPGVRTISLVDEPGSPMASRATSVGVEPPA